MKDIDRLLDKAQVLAGSCVGSQVRDNQLGLVLAHLKRHRSKRATLKLLESLPKSPFAGRTGGTRDQLIALTGHIRSAFLSARTWEEAAQIVGWARRLMGAARRQSGGYR